MPRPALAWKSWSCVVAWATAFTACANFEGTDSVQDAGADAATLADAAVARADADGAAPVVPPGCEIDAPGGVPLACLVDSGAAVFVRAGALDGTGTKSRPYGSISEAIAKRAGRPLLFVSAGEYVESVVVDASISIFGGFAPTFDDPPPRAGKTTIAPPTGPALDVSLGALRMRFDDLVLKATAPKPGEYSSVGVFVHHAGAFEAPVTFRRVAFDGGVALDAPTEPLLPPATTCGAGSCDCAGIEGGKGGGFATQPEAGEPPPPNGGGAAGVNSTGTSSNCTGGAAGGNAADVMAEGSPGAISTQYELSDAGLTGVRGAPGARGRSGGGGGGGGGLAGGLGPTGGKGGDGGCGGAGGVSGLPGGVAVALLALDSIVSLEACSLRAGAGGRGADGQQGQAGGAGAAGGNGFPTCSKKGGKGGDGGDGGDGGGGVGGSTACVLTRGSSLTVQPSLACQPGVPGAGGSDGQVPAGAGQSFTKAELGGDGTLDSAD